MVSRLVPSNTSRQVPGGPTHTVSLVHPHSPLPMNAAFLPARSQATTMEPMLR